MSHLAGGQRTVAIIGIGSPFGADRFGWLAVDWLERSDLCKHFPELSLKFEQADRPGALLLEQLRGADAAIIIDAMQAGLPSGTPRAFTPGQLLTQNTGLLSSHAFGVTESIALGAALGDLPMPLSIIGIEMGNGMSEVAFAAPANHQLLLLVEEILVSVGQTNAMHVDVELKK